MFDDAPPSAERAEAWLAKANLLRLRGDVAAAEAICLDVLAAFPSDVYALCLLGDIRFSQQREHDAAQLYDLAVSTGAAPASVHEKLNAVRSSVRPPTPHKSPTWIVPIAAIVGSAGIIGIFATIAARVQPTMDATSIRIKAPKLEPPVKAVEPEVHTPVDLSPVADVALANAVERLANASPKTLVLAAEHDPRSGSATLTLVAATANDAAKVAAMASFFALESEAGLVSVTARVVHDARIVFVSDMTRQRVDDLRKSYAKLEAEHWMLALSNEWPPNPRAGAKDRP